ncbi:hypothetical protein WR25_24533 [Diploscapter pachys]|uniref:RBR-type E3 ubiquitin transferase n=1 Tax=Diploscapter pachys TaxID=2018661 RepID=A0A2A2JRC5_9BILA|nr:hypothetical protein WR25_24533 [Diploscapter pachys]
MHLSSEDGYFELECETMDECDLIKSMEFAIQQLQDVIEIAPGMCRILLNRYNWNVDKLLENYYSSPELDAEVFLRKARLLPAEDMIVSDGGPLEGDCDICLEAGQLDGLACGHTACSECWKGYLNEKIREGQSEIECMASDCDLLIDDQKILLHITDQRVVDLLRRQQINSYVEHNSRLRWCPTQGCEKAVKIREFGHGVVRCMACKNRFCFGCGFEIHEPLDCELLRIWLKKCKDDSETQNWLIANTKDCPKCGAAIEKNGGCNRMVCKKCNHEFCWSCMQKWDVHGYTIACNKFDDSKDKDATNGIQKSRAALRRYLHYFNRFSNHRNSMRLETKLKEAIENKMVYLQQHSMSWIEVQFLEQAVEVLRECRRTLMYSYGFAYYLTKESNYSLMFEDNQSDLEMATEQLSDILERKTEEEDKIIHLKQIIQDKMNYVNRRRLIILEYCRNGVDSGELEFNVQI